MESSLGSQPSESACSHKYAGLRINIGLWKQKRFARLRPCWSLGFQFKIFDATVQPIPLELPSAEEQLQAAVSEEAAFVWLDILDRIKDADLFVAERLIEGTEARPVTTAWSPPHAPALNSNPTSKSQRCERWNCHARGSSSPTTWASAKPSRPV